MKSTYILYCIVFECYVVKPKIIFHNMDNKVFINLLTTELFTIYKQYRNIHSKVISCNNNRFHVIHYYEILNYSVLRGTVLVVQNWNKTWSNNINFPFISKCRLKYCLFRHWLDLLIISARHGCVLQLVTTNLKLFIFSENII